MIASKHELYSSFLGGQFGPDWGGQFEPDLGGQVKSDGSGLIHRILHYLPYRFFIYDIGLISWSFKVARFEPFILAQIEPF